VFYGNFENLLIHAGGGDDRAVVLQASGAQVTMAGGVGDDQLIGSEGNEILRGGRGRDLLVGGFGQDILSGGPGQDLLVAGDLDGNLDAIASVWVGPQGSGRRVATLRSMVSSIDDDAKDILFGGLGRDWLLSVSLDCD
jgi:Ca2+-binding RTX toxin-like protein